MFFSPKPWAELLLELVILCWDVVILSETWRADEHEYFKTDGGHIFLGSGGIPGKRGVAFLVNGRWANKLCSFIRVDERIAYLDIRLHREKFRFIASYFPHSGYGDGYAQSLYTTLNEIKRDARQRRRRFRRR